MTEQQKSWLLWGGAAAALVVVLLATRRNDQGVAVVPAPGAPPTPLPQAPPSSWATALLARAASDVGVIETSTNSGPRIDVMLHNVGLPPNNQWCAAAVSTWIKEAAGLLGRPMPVPGSGLAQGVMRQLQDPANKLKTGWIDVAQLKADPSLVQPGMIVVWSRGPVNSGLGHIGVVTGLTDKNTFATIEGNSGTLGDRVQRNARHLDDPALLGMGFFREALVS